MIEEDVSTRATLLHEVSNRRPWTNGIRCYHAACTWNRGLRCAHKTAAISGYYKQFTFYSCFRLGKLKEEKLEVNNSRIISLILGLGYEWVAHIFLYSDACLYNSVWVPHFIQTASGSIDRRISAIRVPAASQNYTSETSGQPRRKSTESPSADMIWSHSNFLLL